MHFREHMYKTEEAACNPTLRPDIPDTWEVYDVQEEVETLIWFNLSFNLRLLLEIPLSSAITNLRVCATFTGKLVKIKSVPEIISSNVDCKSLLSITVDGVMYLRINSISICFIHFVSVSAN